MAPEGTTKHKHCLLTFAKGAFAPGLPVMPVLLKYTSVRFNPGWGIVYTAWHFFRVCNQYVNHLEVEVLPIYRPSAGVQAQSVSCAITMTFVVSHRRRIKSCGYFVAGQMLFSASKGVCCR